MYSPPSLRDLVAQGNLSEVKKILKKHKCELNEFREVDGSSVLHLAADCGNVGVLKSLLKEKKAIFIDTKDKEGMTSLHNACLKGHLEAANLLLDNGADCNVPTNCRDIALHFLLKSKADDDSETFATLLRRMLAQTRDLRAQNELGETLLHIACSNGRSSTVNFLLERGMPTNIRTKNLMETCLHHAARAGHFTIVQALLAGGADPDIEGKQGTPKDVADAAGHRKISNLVEEHLFLVRQSLLHTKLPPRPIVKMDLSGPSAVISGAENKDEGCHVYIPGVVSGRSVTTYPYPKTSPCREGSPICDRFTVQIFENCAIIVVTDGCNWGEKPRRAAIEANRGFIEFIHQHSSMITDVQRLGQLMLQGIYLAQEAIQSYFTKINEDPGTTTLLGGVLFQLPCEDGEKKWGLCCVNVGDCKAYLLKHKTLEVVDVSAGNRKNTFAHNDPGGRLGLNQPDLRNMDLHFSECEENDFVFFVSDGVHDNLAAPNLGLVPADFGLQGETWEDADAANRQLSYDACEEWIIDMLMYGILHPQGSFCSSVVVGPDFIPHEGDPWAEVYNLKGTVFSRKDMNVPLTTSHLSVEKISELLLENSQKVTHASRFFMETKIGRRLPKDFRTLPGKMDHTTCACLRVGTFSTETPVEETNPPHLSPDIIPPDIFVDPSKADYITSPERERCIVIPQPECSRSLSPKPGNLSPKGGVSPGPDSPGIKFSQEKEDVGPRLARVRSESGGAEVPSHQRKRSKSPRDRKVIREKESKDLKLQQSNFRTKSQENVKSLVLPANHFTPPPPVNAAATIYAAAQPRLRKLSHAQLMILIKTLLERHVGVSEDLMACISQLERQAVTQQ